MRQRKGTLILVGVLMCTGCMTEQLRNRMTELAGTIPDVYYQEVLNNLAMIETDPARMPYFADPQTSRTRIDQSANMSYGVNWDLISAAPTGVLRLFDRYLLDKQTTLLTGGQINSGEWSSVTANDPDKLFAMRAVYRKVAGSQTQEDEEILNEFQIWEDFAGPGVDDWREIVQTRRIAAILTGHTHYGQVANDGRNLAIATRSIGDPEGGPPGYALGYLHGDDFAIAYRTIEDRGPVVLITHPRDQLLATGPRHIVKGTDQIRVRTWSDSPVRSARGRLDDGDWFDLGVVSPHRFAQSLPGVGLAKGEHALEVEVVNTAGETGTQRGNFFVDPTGRYTAVPAARPVVTKTAYC